MNDELNETRLLARTLDQVERLLRPPEPEKQFLCVDCRSPISRDEERWHRGYCFTCRQREMREWINHQEQIAQDWEE